MKGFALVDAPQVATDEQIALIHRLWATRKYDTKDISERAGVPESIVYSCIHRAPAR